MRNLFAATLIGALAASTAFAEGTGIPDGEGPNLAVEVAGSVTGKIIIDLLPDVAPKHVAQITALAKDGAYDNVVFHRVIDGFMAQTGDVQFGKKGGDTTMAGMGGSELADLPAEFSNRSFARGMVGMARSQSPDSANSQFFIMFDDAPYLDGQYTIVGHVIEGMEIVDKLKKGDARTNGSVEDPDYIVSATVE